jgi:hypothetical protein
VSHPRNLSTAPGLKQSVYLDHNMDPAMVCVCRQPCPLWGSKRALGRRGSAAVPVEMPAVNTFNDPALPELGPLSTPIKLGKLTATPM